MFISLKWKAVAFLSFVLVLLSIVWVGQNVYHIVKQYDLQSDITHAKHEQILEEIVNANFLKLSQFSQILGDKNEIKANQHADTHLQSFLEGQWFSLNINIGLDYLALLQPNGSVIAKSHTPSLVKYPEKLEAIFKQKLQASPDTIKPHSFIYCELSCMQLTVEPIVQDSGAELYIVLGQNIADLIQRYYSISSADLGVVISSDNQTTDLVSLFPERSLSNWNAMVWAVSRYDSMLPLLLAFSQKHPIDSIEDALFSYADKEYLIKPLKLSVYSEAGLQVHFLDIRDESTQQQQLWRSIWNGIATGILVLIVSEIVLIFLMLGPLKRLGYIAKALNLLPEHRYQEVTTLVKEKKSYVRDELSLLEQSTRQVSGELETLHNEVQKSNDDLNKQLSVLSRSRAFLTRLLDNSSLYIVTQSSTFDILSMNLKYRQEVLSATESFLPIFSDTLTKQEFISEIEFLFSTPIQESFHQEVELISGSGDALFVAWTHTLVEDEEGQTIILSIGLDLTQRRKDELALKWLANNDPLTKIGNRRAFKNNLDYMLQTSKRGAVVFIDINRFKQINDLYGHAVGDTVLIEMSVILQENVRNSDFVSRLAGDEFTIVFQNISKEDLLQMLAKLSEALNTSTTLENGQVVEYSASIGASLYPEHGNDMQSLTVHADMAMYQAKKKGANQWHLFNPEDNNIEAMEKEHALASLIRRALKPGSGLFHLVFQPILAIKEKRVSHYEVLLRLADEEGNAVYPDEFIPAAERMGLIRSIDEWVLDHAFSRLEIESKVRENLTFAINISAPTLQSQDLPKMFSKFFEKYDIDSSQVVVELTETAYIENFNQVLANLETLNHGGFMVALDDFGVGFSSFSYLKKMPLSYVKLDGSYIRELTLNEDNQVFVESLSKMVQAFGMRTIAEFVEDQATLDRLEELGVSYAQGYHIGKPISELLDDG